MDGCGRFIGPYPCCTIITGDARELAKAIPDESVDLIFTDPVYDRIEDYRWLAETAARVLKAGGNCIAQAGTHYRHQAECAMYGNGLSQRPLLAEVYQAAYGQLWMHRTLTGWKPYIWLSKGERDGEWCFDRAFGGGRTKQYHEWGDSVSFFIQYIGRLCSYEGIAWDPFCGGGTVAAVCKMLGRHYLAFEIDPDVAERARERVANTQPPLFVMQPEQTEMQETAEARG